MKIYSKTHISFCNHWKMRLCFLLDISEYKHYSHKLTTSIFNNSLRILKVFSVWTIGQKMILVQEPGISGYSTVQWYVRMKSKVSIIPNVWVIFLRHGLSFCHGMVYDCLYQKCTGFQIEFSLHKNHFLLLSCMIF